MRVYLGLGSNLGDRLANLQAAVNFVDLRVGAVTRLSKVYETAPMYVEEQPSFLNAAIEVETALEPSALLTALKEIEAEIGRIPRERNGPREIDLDVLAVAGGTFSATPDLTLPHPRIRERRFVLAPLADVAPHLDLGASTVSQALADPSVSAQRVTAYSDGVLSIHSD
jgi:2-amino-4-hydroxy-6-hydroxymethyldihydropteridine diphosphokinase